jgi:hypothetical protein
MLPDVTENLVVNCDICQEPMTKSADVYACYECKNIIYETDLWRYSDQVKRIANATSNN